MVDEGFTDADGDGYFLEVDDCDDADPNEHPGQTWYKDADNDSYSRWHYKYGLMHKACRL